jgi:AraC-like DNA-binding protein
MLVAQSETRLGAAGVRSTVLLERAVRGHVIARDHLAFDTRFSAAAAGKPEAVGHVFLLLAGRLTTEGVAPVTGPAAFVLADDEFERVGPKSRTFRTDGPRVEAIQLRVDRRHLRKPIGLAHGAHALPARAWDAATGLSAHADDAAALALLLDALAAAGVIAGEVAVTMCAVEPERYARLWSALQPLYATHGATLSLKQVAASLDMSLRQVGRDAKDLVATFGVGDGFRDALLVLRLRAAVLLLAAQGASIGDVAAAVGYGSAIALARAFRDAKLPAPSVIQAELANRI